MYFPMERWAGNEIDLINRNTCLTIKRIKNELNVLKGITFLDRCYSLKIT